MAKVPSTATHYEMTIHGGRFSADHLYAYNPRRRTARRSGMRVDRLAFGPDPARDSDAGPWERPVPPVGTEFTVRIPDGTSTPPEVVLVVTGIAEPFESDRAANPTLEGWLRLERKV